jgi:hypothetical protein
MLFLINYYILATLLILDKNISFEIKETSAEVDIKNLKNISKNLNIEQNFVIARHPNTLFEGFLWGGFVQ